MATSQTTVEETKIIRMLAAEAARHTANARDAAKEAAEYNAEAELLQEQAEDAADRGDSKTAASFTAQKRKERRAAHRAAARAHREAALAIGCHAEGDEPKEDVWGNETAVNSAREYANQASGSACGWFEAYRKVRTVVRVAKRAGTVDAHEKAAKAHEKAGG